MGFLSDQCAQLAMRVRLHNLTRPNTRAFLFLWS
jgi:hypothetical protein